MAMLNNQMVIMPYNGPCICRMVHVFEYDFLLWTVDILEFFGMAHVAKLLIKLDASGLKPFFCSWDSNLHQSG